jgi:hypothetical protein
MPPALHVLWGPLAGSIIPLPDTPVVLGRNTDCDVVIPLSSISRRHAVIRREDDAHVIEDLHSRNHTFVNAQVISTPTRLQHNDRIRLCDFTSAYQDKPLTEEEWLSCAVPVLMLPALWGKTTARKGRLFAAACCRLHWTTLKDLRSQRAVEIAEQFADGGMEEDDRVQAEAAAWRACADIWQAREQEAISGLLWTLQRDHVFASLAEWAVSGYPFDPRDVNGGIPSRLFQECDREDMVFSPLLREVFGNPFRPARIDWLWRTPDVIALANAAYECRDLPTGTLDRAHLGILADALEEAGCTEQAILNHLRGPDRHVRGCWALDLVRSVA